MSIKGHFSKENRGPLVFKKKLNKVLKLNAYPA